MKLYVDDIRDVPEGWTLARTVNEAINFIAFYGEEITHISLDHDISHKVSVSTSIESISRPYPCDETFKAVARYIDVYFKPMTSNTPKITLHTANALGASEMAEILKDFDVTIKLGTPVNRLEE